MQPGYYPGYPASAYYPSAYPGYVPGPGVYNYQNYANGQQAAPEAQEIPPAPEEAPPGAEDKPQPQQPTGSTPAEAQAQVSTMSQAVRLQTHTGQLVIHLVC